MSSNKDGTIHRRICVGFDGCDWTATWQLAPAMRCPNFMTKMFPQGNIFNVLVFDWKHTPSTHFAPEGFGFKFDVFALWLLLPDGEGGMGQLCCDWFELCDYLSEEGAYKPTKAEVFAAVFEVALARGVRAHAGPRRQQYFGRWSDSASNMSFTSMGEDEVVWMDKEVENE